MKKLTALLILVTWMCGWGSAAPGKIEEKELTRALPEKYSQWLDLVTYIITKDERDTFLSLGNDRDREVFISLFWNLRDPSPGTEKNEYRAEHIRRFQYAEKYFKYGTSRAGWKTDRGKIHIILGEPDSKDRYEMDNTVVPCQIWSYYGKRRPGLPNSFWIVFYKKDGIGEYRVYDPASDGPYELLRKKRDAIDMDPMNHQVNYEAIQEEHPVLARASLSLIADDITYNYSPSLRSHMLLDRVFTYPQAQVNDTYATNFLKYKGHVEVDYSINYIEARHQVMVAKDPETGLYLVHFALRPRKISAHASGEDDRFSFHFDLSVSLKKGKRIIFEYRKKFPFSGTRDELLKNFANSLTFSDCFPAAAGDFTLSVLLQNQFTKEFTYFDAAISVPGNDLYTPRLSGPISAGQVRQLHRLAFLPFKFRDLEITPAPRAVYGKEDPIYAVFGVEPGKYTQPLRAVLEVHSLQDPAKYSKRYPEAKVAVDKAPFFTRELEPMTPGYYSFSVRLLDDKGTLLDEKEGEFTVSTNPHVPATSHIFRITSQDNRFLYFHILGKQYLDQGKLGEAETFLAKAFSQKPGYVPLVKDYALLLLSQRKNDRVLEVVKPLENLEKYRFHYFSLSGKAVFQEGNYPGAVELLRRANAIYDSDTTVLNALGVAYLQTGNKEEAKKVLAASLKIDAKQPKAAALLAQLE